MDRNERGLLSGWKEIAAYLDVTVRTAQMWEKDRGLPVHRRPGGVRGRVFAWREEIDAWLRGPEGAKDDDAASSATGGRGAETGEGAPPPGERDPVPAVPAALSARKQFRPLFVGLLVLALVGLGSVFSLLVGMANRGPAAPDPMASCRVDGTMLRVYDADGHLLWGRNFPGTFPHRVTDPGCVVYPLGDEEAESRRVVVWNFPEDRFQPGGTLTCLDERAAVAWERPVGRRLYRGEREFPAAYSGRLLRMVGPGGRYILAVANHKPWYPSEVALLDPGDGRIVDAYDHPGNFEAMGTGDLDGDGSEEIVLGGINNPGAGPGHPVLVVLDMPFSGPHGERRVERDFFGNPGPAELAYVLFPRSDLHRALGVSPLVVDVGVPGNGRLLAIVRAAECSLYYTLDVSDLAAPRVVQVVPDTRYRERHQDLFSRGVLRRPLSGEVLAGLARIATFPRAPDGNAPEVAALLGEPPPGS